MKKRNYTSLANNLKRWQGIVNKYGKTNLINNWSLEDLAEETEYMESDEFVPEEAGTEEEPAPMDDDGFFMDEESFSQDPGMSEDGYGDTEGDDEFNPGEFDESEVDVRSEAELTNIMEVSGTLLNRYYENMDAFFKTNKKCIDYSGDFKANELYEKFVVPSEAVVLNYSKDTQLEKRIENFKSVIMNKRVMTSVCGTDKSPFLYEMFQILYIETLRSCVALIPVSIKSACTIEEAVDKFGFKSVSILFEMMDDVVEISNLLGEKIYFVEADTPSEVTGKGESILSTPYADSASFESMQEVSTFWSTYSATESIMNLIEIRNNKALLELSLLVKMGIVITALTKDVNLTSACNSSLAQVTAILNMDTGDADTLNAKMDDAIRACREEILMPQLERLQTVQECLNDSNVD
ncbi:MAG: hypothetical protein ACRC92_27160 [Peptostreptococcaceae bacterium]